jgi:hypothetical protein
MPVKWGSRAEEGSRNGDGAGDWRSSGACRFALLRVLAGQGQRGLIGRQPLIALRPERADSRGSTARGHPAEQHATARKLYIHSALRRCRQRSLLARLCRPRSPSSSH